MTHRIYKVNEKNNTFYLMPIIALNGTYSLIDLSTESVIEENINMSIKDFLSMRYESYDFVDIKIIIEI